MPTSADENIPLLSANPSPNFFKKSISIVKNISFKTIGIASISALSVVTYYNPAYKAGASVTDKLKKIAAWCGVGTNLLFNVQAYRELLQQYPSLRKMPWKFLAAFVFSLMCVLPNLFMNIVDEDENYIAVPDMILQIISALLNIGVNMVGTMELINYIPSLLNTTDSQKEKIIKEINLAIENLAKKQRLEPNAYSEQLELQAELISQLTTKNDLNWRQKIIYLSSFIGLFLFCIPQVAAYILISYFGMRDLVEKKIGTSSTISVLLGVIAATGNGIPGTGFSLKGVNSISKKLISLEKPSLSTWLSTLLCVLAALFSGFTTHKAMADSLKKLGYSGDIAETLKWTANLGAALIYNLPQMLALVNSMNSFEINTRLGGLKEHLEVQVKNLNASNVQNFKTELPNIISNFFNPPHTAENMDRHDYPLLNSNSSRV